MNTDRNKFNFDHEVKLSCEMGRLIPTMWQDILPGDSVRLKSELFTRAAPMVAPIMHRVNIRTYHVFVPLRQIWEDSEEFFTRGRNMDSTVQTPTIVFDNVSKTNLYKGGLADYLGIPPASDKTVNGNHTFNVLPFRAYQHAWNELFRNQEVETEIDIPKHSSSINSADDAAEFTAMTALRRKNWDNDYFTSAKVQAIINLESAGYALISDPDGTQDIYKQYTSLYNDGQSGYSLTDGTLDIGNTGVGYNYIMAPSTGPSDLPTQVQNLDLSKIGISIEALRKASAMQRWVEKIIRVGYRYKDYLEGVWNQKSSDLRIDRPKYLGGDNIALRISEVTNVMDATTNETPIGTLAGHGIASGKAGRFTEQFEEHGILLQLMAIVPKASYFQGIDEYFFKLDHIDHANPYLADLGMQETPVRQLYYDFEASQTDGAVNFGYKPRYSEYKAKHDRICGDFRDTLSYWHLGREFITTPTLTKDFVNCYPKDDIFAVTTGDKFYVQIYNDMSMLRKLPYYSTPKID